MQLFVGDVVLVPHRVLVGAHRLLVEVDLLQNHVTCPLHDFFEGHCVLVLRGRQQQLPLVKSLNSSIVVDCHCGALPTKVLIYLDI